MNPDFGWTVTHMVSPRGQAATTFALGGSSSSCLSNLARTTLTSGHSTRGHPRHHRQWSARSHARDL